MTLLEDAAVTNWSQALGIDDILHFNFLSPPLPQVPATGAYVALH